MKTFTTSLIAVSAFFSTSLAQSPSQTAVGAIQTLGCYSVSDPLIKAPFQDGFPTDGTCQTECGTTLNKPVMAMTGGSTCYCGSTIPALDKQVDKSKCNQPCTGYDLKNCGGIGYWQVYLSGLGGDVNTAPNSTSQSSSASSKPQATVIVTASSSATPQSGGGPNKVGIAVGVVVGVIAVAGIAGGILFYMRQKRRKAIEEEHKAQAGANPFVGGSDIKSDARLDPSMGSQYRRESIGSIADERDFSRRILQV